MSYNTDELSINEGNPIEFYKFTYYDMVFSYTSSQYTQMVDEIAYSPEFIRRGDTLKLGDSGGTVETCTITVPRTNSVALLYQGAPPELSSVRVEVFRMHGESAIDKIKIIDGIVSQVRFTNSEAELTITIENVLNRYIPRGTLSYSCQNCIYDEKCNLNANDYLHRCYVNEWTNALILYSSNLREKPSGYFTDGYMKMGNSVRAISKHEDNYIIIKYPINDVEKQGSFDAFPGCSQIFATCARRFGNTDNFNGIPYIPPYNVYKHNGYSGRLPYWVDSNLVYRDTKGEHRSMT